MEIVNKKFTLELTEKEIKQLVYALQCEVEYRKERVAELEKNLFADESNVVKYDKEREELTEYRKLRDDIAQLVGTHYTGSSW